MTEATTTKRERRPVPEQPSWKQRIIVLLVALGVLVVVVLIGAAIIPRWWAHRVTDVTEGRLLVGALYGLFVGFVFTALPLSVIALAFRLRTQRRTWKGWVVWLVIAIVTATPNLMTLSIVFGWGDAARDGQLELNTEGNGFRLWSLIGAILAAVVAVALAYVVQSRGRARRQNKQLRHDLAEREHPA